MTKHRVIKYGHEYKIQERFLFFWWSTMGSYQYDSLFKKSFWKDAKYSTLEKAQEEIQRLQNKAPKKMMLCGPLLIAWAGRSLKLSLEMNTFLSQHQKLVPLLMSTSPRIRKACEYFIILSRT